MALKYVFPWNVGFRLCESSCWLWKQVPPESKTLNLGWHYCSSGRCCALTSAARTQQTQALTMTGIFGSVPLWCAPQPLLFIPALTAGGQGVHRGSCGGCSTYTKAAEQQTQTWCCSYLLSGVSTAKPQTRGELDICSQRWNMAEAL